MSDLVPAQAARRGALLGPLADPAGGATLERLRGVAAQPAVRRALPWFAGLAALGGAALTWSLVAPAPQRALYSRLDDGERASVVESLDKASIAYAIDEGTGALTVNADDLYRARMVVAADGAIAAPDSGADLLNNLPIGASRTLEGDRMRAARERELVLTIQEIDGVEAVRVHLAQSEKSAFVRDNVPPSASVLLRLARGRQLSDSQVGAIVNLVAGSVPGLSPDNVKIVDQHGKLVSQRASGDSDRLELQDRMEEKLRAQLAQLLTPMLGAGNFSAEIQVELDMDQVTSARESYEKEGVLRSVTEEQSRTSGGGDAIGVPGVLSNTPPPAATVVAGAPQGTASAAANAPASNGESSASRTYELGREVAVANTTPGKVKRLSVAVALSSEAMKGGKATDIEQLKQLVSAAIGADTARGDQVAVVVRRFDPIKLETPAFYEQPWFATVLRTVGGVLAVLLVLLLAVRPLLKILRAPPGVAGNTADEGRGPAPPAPAASPLHGMIDGALLGQQVSLAQRLAEERPENAVLALRQMLRTPEAGKA